MSNSADDLDFMLKFNHLKMLLDTKLHGKGLNQTSLFPKLLNCFSKITWNSNYLVF